MPDILTRSRSTSDIWQPTILYIAIIGLMILLAGLLKLWPSVITLAFIGIGGTINLATQRICAAIRETRQ